MSVAVVVPWRAGCPHRERALEWVLDRYDRLGWPVVLGSCDPDLPFNRAEAILDAASNTTAERFVVADGDVWAEAIADAVVTVDQHGWCIPHKYLRRLSPESTARVLDGAEWWRLPLSQDNARDRRPTPASPTGAIFVIRRDVLFDVPPDVRFVGWGQEDEAWALALNALHGPGRRGRGEAVHLWHPPQERKSRSVGNDAGEALKRRYLAVRRDPAGMRALVEEGRALWTSTVS
jgi:hypothetical protein